MNARALVGRLALAVGVPLVLLAAAEGLLRVAGGGVPTSFLVPVDLGGVPHWADNPFYGYRFFPSALARNPAPLAIARERAGVVRVAVLGESAAQGDPLLEFGLPRTLEKLLNAAGGTQRYEVINAAMTAISSPVVADIAQGLAAVRPDVVVVYMGNNEAVGPYGPGTVFAGAGAARLVPLRVALTRLRLAQLLAGVARLSGAGAGPEAWAGLDLFAGMNLPAGDPRLTSMYATYEQSLERIIETARGWGARVVLCTVAVNLADCAPFGPEEQAGEAHRAFARARELEAAGDGAGAWQAYARARDLDTRRFRADSSIYWIVRDAAQRYGLELIDSDALFAAAGAGRAPGQRFFLDHVHFTMEGTWRLARAVASVLRGVPEEELASLEEARRLLFFTPWGERMQATQMLERRQRSPFAGQPGNAEQVAWLEQTVRDCEARMNDAEREALGRARVALSADAPEDFFLPFHWGQVLCESGRWAEAVPVLTNALVRLPLHFEARLLPAQALCRTGCAEEAARVLAGPGGPYGLYLADYARQLLDTLQRAGYPAEARRLQVALLKQVPSFPHREAVASWTGAESRPVMVP